MSEAKTLAVKLLEVQRNINKATKGSTNPFFKSKYADLNEVLAVSKEALNAVGVFIAQSSGKDAFGQYVETALISADDGQQINGRVYFSGAENNMQEIGKAITYARRFGLKSLLAMEEEDDDGESLLRKPQAPKPAAPRAEPSPKAAPVQAKVPTSSSRKTVNEKITLIARKLIEDKKATQEDVVTLLKSFGVDSKDKLNDEQARDLLTQLESKLNG